MIQRKWHRRVAILSAIVAIATIGADCFARDDGQWDAADPQIRPILTEYECATTVTTSEIVNEAVQYIGNNQALRADQLNRGWEWGC